MNIMAHNRFCGIVDRLQYLLDNYPLSRGRDI